MIFVVFVTGLILGALIKSSTAERRIQQLSAEVAELEEQCRRIFTEDFK